MTMTKTLSVVAIKHGTVIDHIRPGQAFPVIHFLRLLENKNKVTVGLNLPSKRMGLKDLIKIETRIVTSMEANEIVVFAPEVTINIVKDFEVTQKMNTQLPQEIKNVFRCPNSTCVTHHELIESIFYIENRGKRISLVCHYCEKTFDRDQVALRI